MQLNRQSTRKTLFKNLSGNFVRFPITGKVFSKTIWNEAVVTRWSEEPVRGVAFFNFIQNKVGRTQSDEKLFEESALNERRHWKNVWGLVFKKILIWKIQVTAINYSASWEKLQAMRCWKIIAEKHKNHYWTRRQFLDERQLKIML